MLPFLEMEETIGKAWHRLVGGTASYARHPEHGVGLDEVRGPLAVFFRGLGGAPGVQLAGTTAAAGGHRLGLRQRLGLGEERLEKPARDSATLFLPPRIELFPAAELNRALYSWLAAYCVHMPLAPIDEADPLRRDLLALRQARNTVAAVLAEFPGLGEPHARLSAAMRAARPERHLPPVEAEVEAVVMALLGGAAADGALWQAVTGTAPLPAAPHNYRPFLAVPLWAEARRRQAVTTPRRDDELGGGGEGGQDERKRNAVRRKSDQSQRNDPLMLNRFEKILAMAEAININRATDDDEDENAAKAADDLDEITISEHQGKPATKLKFDLDLPPEAVDPTMLTGELTYPEWDYNRRAYHRDHCRVLTAVAAETGERWTPDDEARQRIRRVRRQFEALRPKHEVLRAQVDGHELDIEALVRARTDLRASGTGSDRIHLALRKQARDMAVTVLVDVSLSTDAWVENRRVLDVEKEALLVLSHGLAACGDDHSILTFTSRRRSWVRIETVKDFAEPLNDKVVRRISALKPGYYTRIGTGIRHAASLLAERPNKHRLLIVLTDGKPNDVDHYEGRYGVEDTRRAVQEVRRDGMAVFGVTIDHEAKAYFPMLFGRGGYAIVDDVARLPSALPAIYRQLTG